MKHLNKNNKLNKPVIVLFWSMPSVSMLDVYKKKSNLLNRAMIEKRAVEILIHNDKILKLKEIGIEAGKFFGLESIKGQMKKMLLNINDIKSVTLI